VQTCSKQDGNLARWSKNQASADMITGATAWAYAGQANLLNIGYHDVISGLFDPGGQVRCPASLRRSPNIARPSVDLFAAHG
jgi:hypothetical protein